MKTLLFLISQFLFTSFLFSEVKAIYKNDVVEISWTNPLHIEIDYFVVERSKNGKSFKKVIKVNGTKLHYDGLVEYIEIDNKPFKKKAFYRIKQVDVNGNTYYSNAVFAKNYHFVKPILKLFSKTEKYRKLKNYQENNVLVVLTDSDRNEFIAKINLAENHKKLVVSYTNTFLPTGIYIITSTSDDRIYGKKIIVQGNYSIPVYTQNK